MTAPARGWRPDRTGARLEAARAVARALSGSVERWAFPDGYRGGGGAYPKRARAGKAKAPGGSRPEAETPVEPDETGASG